MSLRRAAVDILIYEISDEKRPWTLREGALFDPLVSYLVSRACGDDRAWCAGYLDGGERPTLSLAAICNHSDSRKLPTLRQAEGYG